MVKAAYAFKRGETISLSLDLVEGTFSDIVSIEAAIRRLSPGAEALSPDDKVYGTFDIVWRASTSSEVAGWTLTYDAADSEKLDLGLYEIDARVSVGSGLQISNSVVIRIIEPATP